MRENPLNYIRVLPKGTEISIERLFKIGAIDAHYSDAKIEITLPDGSKIEDVYIDWPSKSVLIME